MLSEDAKILEFNEYHDKALFIIHADLESLIVKIDGLMESSTTKASEHIPPESRSIRQL